MWALIVMLLGMATTNSDQDLVDKTKISMFPQNYNHNIYAGYLNISTFKKSLYFIYCQSQLDPDNDPLILWLNGGPGCSSLMGMVSEHGPFVFQQNSTKMVINPYAWNKRANVLYLEGPSGVGFSQGMDAASLITNDTQAAKDFLQGLLRFFDRFPKTRTQSLYLAGESYAGIYIPRLATQIISFNEMYYEQRLNIKGILLGNACTHPTQCYTPTYYSRYFVEFLYTRGFFQTNDYNIYTATCLPNKQKTSACIAVQKNLHDKFLDMGVNIYNAYGKCYYPKYPAEFKNLNQDSNPLRLRHPLRCTDALGSLILFNTNEYRDPLHIPEQNDTLKWTPCTDNEEFKYTIQSRAAYSSLLSLVKYGLKITYYTGDHDAIVPIPGTLFWVQQYRKYFGAAIIKNWRPWILGSDNNCHDPSVRAQPHCQIGNGGIKNQNRNTTTAAGMVWQLDGITVATVLGAGHMVPGDKPREALQLLDIFLGNKDWTYPQDWRAYPQFHPMEHVNSQG